MPHEIILSPKHDEKKSMGWLIWAAIEELMVHGDGIVIGEPVKLPKETGKFIVNAYALDSDGYRLYSKAFFSRAKGFAKSEVAAFLCIAEALFPIHQFDHWATEDEPPFVFGDFVYYYEVGEPVGRRAGSPYIRIMSTEASQNDNVYVHIKYNFTENENFSHLFKSGEVGYNQVRIPGGGTIKISTASGASKDGGKETFAVADETHLYTNRELQKMYETVDRNTGKNDPYAWILEISTMFAPGEGSVAEQSFESANVIKEGVTKHALFAGLLFDYRSGFANTDISDMESVLASLREAYGDFAEMLPERVMINKAKRFFDKNISQADNRRYYLNQPVGAVDAWVEPADWVACRVSEQDYNGGMIFVEELGGEVDMQPLMPQKGDVITLGFDGSHGSQQDKGTYSVDATALIACRVSDGFMWEIGVWEQPEGPAGVGWMVPKDEVDEMVDKVFEQFTVVGFYADPAYWIEYVSKWERKYRSRLKTKVTPSSPIKFYMLGSWTKRAALMITEFRNAIINGNMKHYSLSESAFSRHVINAREREKNGVKSIGKETPHSEKKIDAAVAAAMAWQARIDVLSVTDGARKNKRTIYRPIVF